MSKTNAWNNEIIWYHRKSREKTKNGENVSSLEVVEEVLVQFSWPDNQYQQKSEILYTFTPSKSCAYRLNVELSNSVFLKNVKYWVWLNFHNI